MTTAYPTFENILSEKFLAKYRNKQPDWGFNGLGYFIYKRTYARVKPDGSTEEWNETIERCIRGAQKIGAKYTTEEAERLFDYMFSLKGMFSGRGLWQLGTPLADMYADSLLNCWGCKVSTIEDFCFIFMESMFGGGVGCNITKEFVFELPRIQKNVVVAHKNTKDAEFIVPDSKEGWCDLWRKILEAYFVTGKSFTYSTICIRPEGEPLKTFGGIAPGPRPLIEGTKLLIELLQSRSGKKLRTQDVADIICIGGEVVKSGGVRRTALILGGDPDDTQYLELKRWDLGTIPYYRSNSNNSVFANYFRYLNDKFWSGYYGNGEAYGIVNLRNCRRFGRLNEVEFDGLNLKEPNIVTPNPCQPAWATILTENGIRQLKDIDIGSKIWSKDGWTTVVNKWSTGINKVYKYSTNAGVFYGTENHKLVSDGEKIEAKDCESVDILTGPVNYQVEHNIEDIMDGLVIGDGTVHKASNNLVLLIIGGNDHDYFDSEISSLILKHRPGIADHCYEVATSIKNSELELTYNRKIPNRFFHGNFNTVCGFLRGLFSANGGVSGQRVTLKASSKSLIDQVQLMLSGIGIKSYITTNKEKDIKFSNGTYTCKESYDINISVDREKFRKLVGFIQEYKNTKLDQICEKESGDGKTTYEIIGRELISEEETFDITVDNTSHTYWTGGVNVSNCGEALVEDKEPCNLAEIHINKVDSLEEAIDIALLLYKTNKAICAREYYHEATNKVVHRNFKIGISITGVCQKYNEVKNWADPLYRALRAFDKKWSKENGYPESIKLTVIQPSGTKGLLSGAMPGAHPGFSEYFIRRIRFSSNDPLLPTLRKLGVKMEPELKFDGSVRHDVMVAEFPCTFEQGIVSKDMSAIQQLELVKELQTNWADQAVSVTVYYREEELDEIKKWLSENYDDSIKTVSFLRHSDHGFAQAPYEEITKEEYIKRKNQLKPLVNVKVSGSELFDGLECVGGSCPVR